MGSSGFIAVLWVVGVIIVLIFAYFFWRFIIVVPQILSDISEELKEKNRLYREAHGLKESKEDEE